MSMASLKKQIGEAEAALKARLVDLYNKLRSGQLSDDEKARLNAAIAEIKAQLEPQTKRLIGDSTNPAQTA